MIRASVFCILIGSWFFAPLVHATENEQVQEPKEVIAHIVSMQSDTIFNAKTDSGEIFQVDTKLSYPDGVHFALEKGDRVKLRIVEMPDGTRQVFFDDKVRTPAIMVLFMFFVALTIIVGLFRGVFSLIGLGLTLVILFAFLFPNILAGKDPVLMTVIASFFILLINIHLSHGFKKRSFFAFLGTIGGLLIVWILSLLFSRFASLSGLGTEEASFLLWDIEAITDPVAIFISAVILGAVGVLDDVAVSQSEIVDELQRANPNFSRKDLFLRAMRVGRHHIASTVNTLVLVYAGAALPMFLLFYSSSISIDAFLNTPGVAEEIVRVLAGTSALILTVPLSTAFATIAEVNKIDRHEKRG